PGGTHRRIARWPLPPEAHICYGRHSFAQASCCDRGRRRAAAASDEGYCGPATHAPPGRTVPSQGRDGAAASAFMAMAVAYTVGFDISFSARQPAGGCAGPGGRPPCGPRLWGVQARNTITAASPNLTAS